MLQGWGEERHLHARQQLLWPVERWSSNRLQQYTSSTAVARKTAPSPVGHSHLNGGGSSPSYTLNRPCSLAFPPTKLPCRALPGVPPAPPMPLQSIQ